MENNLDGIGDDFLK